MTDEEFAFSVGVTPALMAAETAIIDAVYEHCGRLFDQYIASAGVLFGITLALASPEYAIGLIRQTGATPEMIADRVGQRRRFMEQHPIALEVPRG